MTITRSLFHSRRISFTVLLISSAICAGAWPQFKNTPDRLGCNLSESVALPANLCCWVNMGSPVEASPVIQNGKVYAISSNGVAAKIDLSGNTVDWAVSLGGVNNRSTPAVSGGRLFAGTTEGKLYVLSTADGSILNTYQAGAQIFADLLLVNGRVYFGSFDGVFHALDTHGVLKWTYQANTNIKLGAAFSDGKIVFPDGNSNLISLTDNGTGGIENFNLFYPDNYLCTTVPVIYNGYIYEGRANVDYIASQTYMVKFNLSDGAKVANVGPNEALYRTALSVDTATGAFYYASAKRGVGTIGAPRNWNTCLTGAKAPDAVSGVNSSPVLIKNLVIFGAEDGRLYFYKKDDVTDQDYLSGGKMLWSFVTGAAVSTSPAVSGGKVVFGGFDGHIYGLGDGPEVSEPISVDSSLLSTRTRTALYPKWSVSVFPNPAIGNLVHVRVAGIKQGYTFSIYDVSGRLLRRFVSSESYLWDCRDNNGRALPSGHYPAVLRDAGGRKIKAFNLQMAH